MTIFKNILIFVFATTLSALFVYGSFVFDSDNGETTSLSGTNQIKTTIVNIATDNK